MSGATITLEEGVKLEYLTASNATLRKINWINNIKLTGGIFVNIGGEQVHGVVIDLVVNGTIKQVQSDLFNYSCFMIRHSVNSYIERCVSKIKASDNLEYSLLLWGSLNSHAINNEFNSNRTAIDLTRLSKYCSAKNNKIKGNLSTHTSHYCDMSENSVSEGGLLIRSPFINVINNEFYSKAPSNFSQSEAASAGPSRIEGNLFIGAITGSRYIFANGTTFKNNTFLLSSIDVGAVNTSSLFRINNKTPEPFGVQRIIGNKIIYTGANEIEYCFNTRASGSDGLSLGVSTIIEDNITEGFSGFLHFQPFSTFISGSFLVVKNNKLTLNGGVTAIKFLKVDHSVIADNNLFGSGLSGDSAFEIVQSGTMISAIVKNNVISDYEFGLTTSAFVNITVPVLSGNVGINVTTINNTNGVFT